VSELLDWQKFDYYAMLGVTRMADEEAIRKAFRARAKECHPDRFPFDSSERADAEAYFKKLMVAKDVLLDAKQREAYDREQDLVQQAFLQSVVYEVPVQKKAEPDKASFKDALRSVYEQRKQENHVDYVVGATSPQAKKRPAYDEDDEGPSMKGIPEHARKNTASYYYSMGLRMAARGDYRRALHALSNARMLDPDLPISEATLSQIRSRAYYNR
jgi:curved DNA-binding protein CbpA